MRYKGNHDKTRRNRVQNDSVQSGRLSIKLNRFAHPSSLGGFSKVRRVDGDSQVVIYTTDWRPVCRCAKAHYPRQGIRYVEYDVEKSAKGCKNYRRLKGRGVPIIPVGNRRRNGFNRTALEQWLQ